METVIPLKGAQTHRCPIPEMYQWSSAENPVSWRVGFLEKGAHTESPQRRLTFMCPQGVRAGALGHRRASLNRPSSFTIWEVCVLQGFFFFFYVHFCMCHECTEACISVGLWLWCWGGQQKPSCPLAPDPGFCSFSGPLVLSLG